MPRLFVSRLAWLVLLLVMTAPADAAWQMNLTEGVTAMTHKVWDLHMAMLAICVVIGGGVCLVMAISIARHRKARGVTPASFRESVGLEIAWTVIPFAILIGVAIPAASLLISLADTGNADMTIDVTGHQWLWEYEYPGADVHFYSRLASDSRAANIPGSGTQPADVKHYLRDVDQPMVVPVGAKVALNITSDDVIHSWWVPALGGKMDAIPGQTNHKWFRADKTGVYRGQCAELCGRGHAFMPIVVRVVSKSDYIAWLNEQGGHLPEGIDLPDRGQADESAPPAAGTPTPERDHGSDAPLSHEQLMARGEQIYDNVCAACHQPDGSGLPAAGFPALTGSDIATGPVAAHIDRVLHGKKAMPAFGGVLSDADIAGVVTYERNALGNDTGDTVQPADVKKRR
ncbi:cytochrome c oxidase subunit II [Salinisphaera sp. SPP-AMP-43]|uniref:cytochrome c oxidase subunit II n=1 Tax=Salinisphaera sp. SPP-AMP-43 TaxID=3121288 RepID=UPI003C6E6DB0